MPTDEGYFSRFKTVTEQNGDRTFLTFYEAPNGEPVEYYFREFWRGCASYAEYFLGYGIACGDVVLIFGGTRIEVYYAFFGAQLAGAVPSVMPPPNAKQDFAYYRSSHHELVRRIQPRLICGPRDVLSELDVQVAGTEQVPFEELAAKPNRHGDRAWPSPRPGQLSLLQHSSGTTGLKKGVMLAYGAVQQQIDRYGQTLRLGDDDRIVSWLPLYHDMGLVACTVLPFVTATPIVAMDPFTWLGNPLLMLQAVERHRCTLAWLPNFAFEHLTNVGRRLRGTGLDLSSLRMLIDCSEVCRAETLDRFFECYGRFGVREDCLQTCYALAENVFAASQSVPGARPRRILVNADELDRNRVHVLNPRAAPGDCARQLVSSGLPLAGSRIAVLTGSGLTTEDDSLGEILLRTDCLFSGYYKNDELSRERLVDGWYHTRDLGFLHEQQLFVLGRLDDVIIYRGRNIFAADLEAALSGISGVKPGRAISFGIYDEAVGSEQVVVLAERNEESSPATADAIEASIRARLIDRFGINPLYVLIRSANSLKKTTSGKLSRSENKREFIEVIRKNGD